jgi:hypothetical protein
MLSAAVTIGMTSAARSTHQREIECHHLFFLHRANVLLDAPEQLSPPFVVWFNFVERLPEIDLDRDEQLAADLVAPR